MITSSHDPMDYMNSSDSPRPSKSSGDSASKGGRKPMYTTTEERKQRNRQAQAAFRERRTEHIKELEELVFTQKSDYQRLQAAHNQATDECLMLRYKNSLLERILLEKGIDVQAELYERRDTSYLDPMQGVSTLRRPPIARPRNHSTRKSLQINSDVKRSVDRNSNSPPSLATSPQSSGTESNMIPTPPATSPQSTFRPVTKVLETTTPRIEPIGALTPPQAAEMAAANILKKLKGNQSGSMRDTAAYFLSSFLEHIETLEKEAETTPSVPIQTPARIPTASMPTSYAQSLEPLDCQMDNTQQQILSRIAEIPTDANVMSTFPSANYYEQMLHADPFGLEASLHFPTASFKF